MEEDSHAACAVTCYAGLRVGAKMRRARRSGEAVSSHRASVRPDVTWNEYISVVNIACVSPVTQSLLIGVLRRVQECRPPMATVLERVRWVLSG